MNADDPKFTAHVLGEFDDLTPGERAEIEALMTNDPTAAAAAEETRALAARLRAELPGETASALDTEQRAAVLKAAKIAAVPGGKVVRFPRLATVLATLAACVIVGVSYALLFQAYHSDQAAKGTAETSAPVSRFVLVSTPVPEDPTGAADLAPPPAPAAPVQLTLAQKLQNELDDTPKLATSQPVAVPPKMESLPAEPAAAAKRAPATSLATITTKDPVMPEMRWANPVASQKAMPVAQAPVAQSAASSVVLSPVHVAGRRDSATSLDAASSGAVALADAAKQRLESRRYFYGQDAFEYPSGANTSKFDALQENGFLNVRENPLSTFSVDVDTASYAIVRRYLNDNQLPPQGAVRVEELLNYFTYDYPQPKGDAPFSATMEVAACPWAPEHRLVRVGLKGREIAKDQRPASNLVFLIDVSGSMNMPNKLPLIQKCFNLLVEQLGPKDRVSIVTYASGTTVVLEPTQNKEAMQMAIAGLRAGGCTYGSSGIELAYQLAEKSFIPGGTNRVILATDGDWNVGITDERELMQMITQKAKSGVFLTVLGCGMDNLKDSMLVKLADHGNGHYAYIDTELEARKVFVDELSSTLVTIAKDVKIQVEFNPAQVSLYRLIGYEKRLLAKEDFNNDKKDAGEIGAGHTVTALYEVVPVGKGQPEIAMVDKLKYQPMQRAIPVEKPAPPSGPEIQEREKILPAAPAPEAAPAPAAKAEAVDTVARKPGSEETNALSASVRKEMLTLKLRYKEPEGEKSKLLEFPLTDGGATWEKSSPDFRFAAAVASYGMLLRGSNYVSEATWQSTARWAREGLGVDQSGYRAEFLSLLEKGRAMKQ